MDRDATLTTARKENHCAICGEPMSKHEMRTDIEEVRTLTSMSVTTYEHTYPVCPDPYGEGFVSPVFY